MDDYEIPYKMEGIYLPNKYAMNNNTNVMSALPYDNYTGSQPREYRYNERDEKSDREEYNEPIRENARRFRNKWKIKDTEIPLTPEDAEVINISKIGNLKKDIQRENFTLNGTTISNTLSQLSDTAIMFIVIVALILYLIYAIRENSMEIRSLQNIIMLNWPKKAQ